MGKKHLVEDFTNTKKSRQDIQLKAHIQMCMLTLCQKAAHSMQVQVDTGTVAEKLGPERMQHQVPVNQVFRQNEMIDVIRVTKGNRYK